MTIELLTSSAGDYASSQDKKLSEYKMIGLRYEGETFSDATKKLIEETEKHCIMEIVTDLKYAIDNYHVIVSGTGLERDIKEWTENNI